jgi:hypothetical protein
MTSWIKLLISCQVASSWCVGRAVCVDGIMAVLAGASVPTMI